MVEELGLGPLRHHLAQHLSRTMPRHAALQVQNELSLLDKTDTASASLARVNYHQECEAAMNEQIKCVRVGSPTDRGGGGGCGRARLGGCAWCGGNVSVRPLAWTQQIPLHGLAVAWLAR